jgi:hypothetical protein
VVWIAGRFRAGEKKRPASFANTLIANVMLALDICTSAVIVCKITAKNAAARE